MGTTTSREASTRQKYRRKLPSLKSQRHTNNNNNNDNKKTIRDNSNDDSTNSPTTSSASEDPSSPKLNPVNLVRHQVVLSDHVSPMSSLSAVISIPMRRSSWRKSVNTTTKIINDNTSFTSSFFDMDEDDDRAVSSPRTSVISEDNSGSNNNFLKVSSAEENYNVILDKKKNSKKKRSSFSSLKNVYKRGEAESNTDIVFESKYSVSPIPSATSNRSNRSTRSDEEVPILKVPPRPFWPYNNNDEREYDRQLRQHYVLKHILDGNIHVPVPTDKPITILDAACGAGFWTSDIAHTYPNAKVIGLDAFTADDKKMKEYSNATISAPNIVYKYGVLTTHLSLPDNYIDIIYQRDTTSIMPHERWPFLLKELSRISKPGGYLELVEYNFNILDPGPVLALVNEWYKIASSSVGVDPREAKHLKSMITSAGFKDVEKKVINVPIGEWPTDEADREKGFLYKAVIKSLFKSMKPWWIYELGVSEQEYDKVVTAAMDEFDEQCCSVDWVIYTARKTPAPSTTVSTPAPRTPSTTTVSFDL